MGDHEYYILVFYMGGLYQGPVQGLKRGCVFVSVLLGYRMSICVEVLEWFVMVTVVLE